MNTIASPRRSVLAAAIVSLTALSAAFTTEAAVFTVSEAALSEPTLTAAEVVDFTEVALGTLLQGQTIDGFTFSESGVVSGFDARTSNASGNTNSVTTPGLFGGTLGGTYKLTITMAAYQTAFGFGFVLAQSTPTLAAVTVTLFDGATNVGALTFDGGPDPSQNGGFAGIGSTIAFNVAEITFNPAYGSAFVIDNVAAFNNQAPPVTPVPEPGSALIGAMVLGVCGLGGARRRR